MSNHVHLIVVPHADDSLAWLVRRVHSSYAQDFNRRRSRDGHLWRSRFYSCPLGPSHLDAALLYVDLNPVRAAMTGTATAWEWSSARAHVSGQDESGLLSAGGLARFAGCADWEQRLRRGQPRVPSARCVWPHAPAYPSPTALAEKSSSANSGSPLTSGTAKAVACARARAAADRWH